MVERVKSPRRYNSPRRREQAAATRRQVLQAAQRLFEQHGYAATSMAAIASEAGVSLKTVYLAFETKSGLLRALWHLLLRGDEEAVPVGARPWFQELLHEPDPARQLRLNVRNAKLVRARIGPLLEVIRSAAAHDPEIDALWGRIQSEFYDNQRSVVEALHQKRALKPSLTVARATDILWTLNHPNMCRLLVTDRGWAPDQHEKWLAEVLCSQLLRTRTRSKADTRKSPGVAGS
jgi:AcrR family transcriptional regulator